ncbi:LuxR C-terminal-related transcriptional regulator [uncultured Muribaculum sp.]|uniref:helix-turn-helix transcriptional regulator n=1 Tax=uncultured Muribaculum sp. TaxID=1918613 RepID=UPI0025B0859B|nr:LuxR C-terminal-related transcriptional regulator [uncultured Muribaculum sp.]
MDSNIIVFLDDTLQAIGLQSLLLDYFGCTVVRCRCMSEVEAADCANAIIITSGNKFCNAFEFFSPRRSRVVIVSDIASETSISANEDEGTIVELLGAALEKQKKTRLETPATSQALSHREENVLGLIARGYINKEIADMLEISINTVLTHRKNIMTKLGIRSVSGLSLYALMNGYVTQDDVKR